MSRSKEMKEKFDKIRELQEQRDRHERDAQSQAEDLDAILEASRRAHGEDQPLVSSSRLSGPGFGSPARSRSTDPENAYDASFNAARFASPNAFSRTRTAPVQVPDGSSQGLAQRQTNSAAAAATSAPTGAPLTREPVGKTPPAPPSTTKRTEHTVTMTVKAFAPTKSEVTQVVRKRNAALGNRPRREPTPVADPSLQTAAFADGPAVRLPGGEDTPIAGHASEGTVTVPGTAMGSDPTRTQTSPHTEITRRVTFKPTAANSSSRKVTSPGYGIGLNVSHDTAHSDTVPTPASRLHTDPSMQRDGYEDTTPGMREITTPGGGYEATSPGHEITTPGGGFEAREITTPGGGFEATSPGREVTTPGRREITAPGFKQITVKGQQPPPPPRETTSPGTNPGTDPAIEHDTSPGPSHVEPSEPTAIVDESVVDDEQFKRVREMDALIARFASDVEVKTGSGRENTFLRKRSEIQGATRDDEFPDEHTVPRHRNIEVRRENTEVIPRPLPPRKRR